MNLFIAQLTTSKKFSAYRLSEGGVLVGFRYTSSLTITQQAQGNIWGDDISRIAHRTKARVQ